MKRLNYKCFGHGEPIVICHGLFGSLSNWLSIAKSLSEHFLLILVDLRNHGESFHCKSMTYLDMAQDVIDVLDDLGINQSYMIGHSMGGKVVMQVAASYPDRLLKGIVVDIAPKQYELNRHDAVFNALFSVDLNQCKTRSDVDKQLSTSINDASLRQFLVKNISARQGVLEWKIGLRNIYENYSSIASEPQIKGSVTVPMVFIRGADSDYILSQDVEYINRRFSMNQLITIDQASHWVHIQQPKTVASVILNAFNTESL